jgi:hypothetical protein
LIFKKGLRVLVTISDGNKTKGTIIDIVDDKYVIRLLDGNSQIIVTADEIEYQPGL